MAQTTVAPWAEPVPNVAGQLTAEELARLPEDGWMYELVEGRLVRMPPAGFEHGEFESDLGGSMRSYARQYGLGGVSTGEPGFILSGLGEPDTVLAPDIAFVQADRLPPPGSRERRGFLRLAPDLVVEVASPDQSRPEMAAKVVLWLKAGVRVVWVIWPARGVVDVWRPGKVAPVATLTSEQHLDGLDVVPGFTYRVGRLFE